MSDGEAAGGEDAHALCRVEVSQVERREGQTKGTLPISSARLSVLLSRERESGRRVNVVDEGEVRASATVNYSTSRTRDEDNPLHPSAD